MRGFKRAICKWGGRQATLCVIFITLSANARAQETGHFLQFISGAEQVWIPGLPTPDSPNGAIAKALTVLYVVPHPQVPEVASYMDPMGIKGSSKRGSDLAARTIGLLEHAQHTIYVKKKMMERGDAFHQHLLTSESPLDGSSAMIGIFDGPASDPTTFDHPVATLRLAIPEYGKTPLMKNYNLNYQDLYGRPMKDHYIQRRSTTQQVANKPMMAAFADFLTQQELDSESGFDYGEALKATTAGPPVRHSIIKSIRNHEDLWTRYVNYHDEGALTGNIRMQFYRGDAPRFGGPPAELKGLSHDGSSYDVEALFFLFYRAYLLGFFDWAPATLTGYVPSEYIGITTPKLLEDLYVHWGMTKLREVYEPSKGPAVIVNTDRSDLWRWFFGTYLKGSVSEMSKAGAKPILENSEVLIRILNSHLILPDYFVSWVPIDKIPLQSCAYAFGVDDRVFKYFNPTAKGR